MVHFSDLLEFVQLLAEYTFIPILLVISVALFINLILRYRRRVIGSDEESAIIKPLGRSSLESRRTQQISHSSQTEEAGVTEPRILLPLYQ